MRVTYVFLLPLLVLLSGCNNPAYEKMAEKRLSFARENQGDIHIAAIQDLRKSGFLNGVLLAAEEINLRPTKLLGRTLQVQIEPGAANFQESKRTIRRIASNPKITAVIGHRSSKTAIPASVIYERSQIIFMPPFATAKKLTNYYFQYVFRMMPSNTILAEQIASVAQTLGYQKVVLLYTRDDFSREQAFLAEEALIKQGINIVSRASFFTKSENYRSVISEFSSSEFDALFIAAPPASAGLMVQQLREMGVNQPILGSDLLNSTHYLKAAANSAENTIIPDVFPPKQQPKKVQAFIDRYQAKYKVAPDFNAAQGYDSVMLLANGIERAGSTIPSLLASTLHYMPAWVGVTGIHAFTQTGEMRGKKYFFKVWQQGQWHHMPAIDAPYTLQRFQQQLSGKTTDFSRAFAKKIHNDDHKSLLLDLSQEILHFKRIGIIYEDTEAGRKAADYPLLKHLAKQKQFEVVDCKVPLSRLSPKQLRQSIIACYGKLSLNADALFLPPYHGADASLLAHLNLSLSFFKIPVISLDQRNSDPNLSLVLGRRSDINLRASGDLQIYRSLLKNLKVHEFAVRLKNLPELTVNLKGLQQYGLSDQAILSLSPEHYLEGQQP